MNVIVIQIFTFYFLSRQVKFIYLIANKKILNYRSLRRAHD